MNKPHLELEPSTARSAHALCSADSVKAPIGETSEYYPRVICQFEQFRVIVCKGEWQWILQRCSEPEKLRATAWRAIGYFRTQRALMAAWRVNVEASICECWPELEALPKNFASQTQRVAA